MAVCLFGGGVGGGAGVVVDLSSPGVRHCGSWFCFSQVTGFLAVSVFWFLLFLWCWRHDLQARKLKLGER